MRALVVRAFEAAIRAVDARRATEAALAARPIEGRVFVLALGKAALAMSAGALDACSVERGLVIAPRVGRPIAMPPGLEVLLGQHPVPDEGVARRGEALLAFAASVPRDATALVLISGGGSALVDAPVSGVSPDDVASLTRRLLASGASIEELNAIRIAHSRLKGGGLARAIGAPVRTLVVSDIPFGAPSQVASGPMSRWEGASPREVAARPHLARALTRIERERCARWRATRTVDATLEVVADNARAVAAAMEALRAEGHLVAAGPPLVGEARVAGRTWARVGRYARVDAMVGGGETTVAVRGTGRGGRNQEMALAALEAGLSGTLLCAGTDGIDGPTDAAGAIVGSSTEIDARAIRRALDDNDSYHALRSASALLVTGPTGTNVADLAVWVSAARAAD